MINFPNCKINLGLRILRKRQDGFHDVETGLYPLKLNDLLEIIPATDGSMRFEVTGLFILGDDPDNLVMKAYMLMKEAYGLPPVHIHLHKIIPMGAGLGGGSADAAFTLKLLNRLFGLKLGVEKLEEMARSLGSDCAFFIQNKPAIATGRGDRFITSELNLSGYHLVLVKPNILISSPEAYSWIRPNDEVTGLADILKLPVESWTKNLVNDFEKPVFHHYPQIANIKKQLVELGASYASLTGSGAAVFGLFKSELKALSNFRGCFVWQEKL